MDRCDNVRSAWVQQGHHDILPKESPNELSPVYSHDKSACLSLIVGHTLGIQAQQDGGAREGSRGGASHYMGGWIGQQAKGILGVYGQASGRSQEGSRISPHRSMGLMMVCSPLAASSPKVRMYSTCMPGLTLTWHEPRSCSLNGRIGRFFRLVESLQALRYEAARRKGRLGVSFVVS